MLYLIDASVYVFRAYYSVPPHLTDPGGRPVNAVYGFGQFLCDFLEQESPQRVGIAFDESLTTSFRNEIYPDYKANREEPPEGLIAQFALCRELCSRLGLFHCANPDYEADDLIGSLLRSARRPGEPGAVVTRDKDLAQLIQPGDVFYDYAAGTRLGYGDLAERWGVAPEQIADLLALTGDSIDNIPGVPGIGPKTAARLLGHFDDVNALIDNIQAIDKLPVRGAARIRKLLERHQDQVRLALRLTKIKTDIPLSIRGEDLRRQPSSAADVDAFFDQLGFGGRLRARAVRLAAAT